LSDTIFASGTWTFPESLSSVNPAFVGGACTSGRSGRLVPRIPFTCHIRLTIMSGRFVRRAHWSIANVLSPIEMVIREPPFFEASKYPFGVVTKPGSPPAEMNPVSGSAVAHPTPGERFRPQTDAPNLFTICRSVNGTDRPTPVHRADELLAALSQGSNFFHPVRPPATMVCRRH